MQRESMGGEGIATSSADAASKAFSQAMSFASMPNMQHYSNAGPAPTSLDPPQSHNELFHAQNQHQQLLSSAAAAVMNAGAITCLVCYNAQVNIMLEPCRHQFHAHCIDRWLNKDKVCPVCWIPIQSSRPIVSAYSSTAPPQPPQQQPSQPQPSTSTPSTSTPYAAANSNTGSTPSSSMMLSGAAAANILPAQAAANMEHPNPPSMRKGKWTNEESAFCDRLIEEFKKGNLPLAEGTTLRTFLSKLLNCDPMRISKKYTGDQCIGKIIFRRREDELTADEMETIRRDLADLEKTYLEREQYNQRRREKRLESELSRDKNRFMAAARNATTTNNNNSNSSTGTTGSATTPSATAASAAAASMAAFNAAAVTAAVNAMRPPPPQQPQQQQTPYPSTSTTSAVDQHLQQQRALQQQQQQQAYQQQLAAQQRHQMMARAQQQQQQQPATSNNNSMAPPRHPPAQQQQQQQQHTFNGGPPSTRMPQQQQQSMKDDAFQSDPTSSGHTESTSQRLLSVPSTSSSSSDLHANSLSLSRVSSIDSFGCMFPRVASVDGFGSHSATANDTSAIGDQGTGGMVKSISIGDGLSAYFPRIQSLEHLSSLLQEHAPTSPQRNVHSTLSRLNITVKSEENLSAGDHQQQHQHHHQHPHNEDHHDQQQQHEDDPTSVQIRDADLSKRLSPPTTANSHTRSAFADHANQIQVPKPLSKMPRSSSGIFPRVPSMDKLPRVPSMDKLPRIPSMDKLPSSLDSIPRAPSMNKLPRVPSLDKNLSRISSSSDMLSRFGSTDHLSSFPSFSNLTGLAPSASFDKLSALGGSSVGGGLASAFRAGGFPRNSSIEDILSLVASSDSTGGLNGSNSSLQLSALAVLAGEESAANDRKRRRDLAASGGTNGQSTSDNDAMAESKKSRVSA